MILDDISFQEVSPATISGDRRTGTRCSIQLPIQFKMVGSETFGHGEVLNMCSTGIAFRSRSTPRCGSFVHVSIPWLATSPDSGTTLLAYGRVVRTEQNVTAIQVLRHEFQRQELKNNQQEHPVSPFLELVPAPGYMPCSKLALAVDLETESRQ